jgi:hypothetical protein
MKIRTTLLLAAVLLAAGCGHTNNLAKYKVAGSTALFRAYSSGSAEAFAGIRNPSDKNIITGILAALGSGIISQEGRKKLDRAIDPDTIANAVALGMTQATSDYLGVRPVASIADDPEFLIETELTDYKLVSVAEGLFARVRGKSRMIHRKSGAVVWDNAEAYNVPLSSTYLASLAPSAVASGISIYNAVQLLQLSEEEIRKVINEASMQVGREIGETLREDVAEINTGK